jgi:hypothetical protein
MRVDMQRVFYLHSFTPSLSEIADLIPWQQWNIRTTAQKLTFKATFNANQIE